ncbi:MAG TPA: hypothetical protein PJ997_00265 [Candidatus Paceibacterota bacterium]|nr:hypothetical protein [Candidatus Paceibacterota bacterium]HMP18765.1 hypothetical protein [Candidatus Paceibacterota bacterium]HMP85338.1 hypothetical protein [Candidatus Paceibacterota bacterium]
MNSFDIIQRLIEFLILILPIFLPIILTVILVNMWINYARNRFLADQEYKILRIVPPMDIFKTPLSMELFMNALSQTVGEATPIDKYWKGKVRPWFSLEIASNGGDVGFYVWTRKNMVGYLQSQIYAQYPGIEVFEVEDYTKNVDYNDSDYSIWATEFELTAPDPVPIKTYVDYGLDKASEEEEKTDPITPMLEFMGSIKQGEFVWLQIIVRSHKKEDKDPTKWFGLTDKWKDDAKDLIKKIREDSMVEVEAGEGTTKVPLATKGQIDKINAIERSISKLPFDVGIRGMYVAEKDVFDPVNIAGLAGGFKQYSSSELNGFKPGIKTGFDYWWEDPTGNKLKAIKQEIFEAYRERGYFFRPFFGRKRKHFILNSEELATIYHFPGSVSHTPSLQRVHSKKSEAPADLPI